MSSMKLAAMIGAFKGGVGEVGAGWWVIDGK